MKMNWARYKFSKECEPELAEFFKAVAEQQSSSSPPTLNKELWKKFLPVDLDFQERINSNRVLVTSDVIDITESDDEETEKHDTVAADKGEDEFLLPNESFYHLTGNRSRLNVTTTEDLVNEVQDLLETEELLSEDTIKQFGTEDSQTQLREIFTLFGSNLNSECTLKLWQSVIAANCMEANNVATYFLQHVLVQKTLSKHDPSITKLLFQVLDTHPDEATAVLVKILLETDNSVELRKLKDNLSALTDDHKNILLREFENSCNKLELHHLGTVLSLICAHTRIENLTKLIELMLSVCKELASEKTFGKILLEVIQTLGGNVIHCEDHLRHIIATHKSIFKAQIMKIFDSSLQDHKMFSQSLRY